MEGFSMKQVREAKVAVQKKVRILFRTPFK